MTDQSTAESVFPQLEALLPHVQKPIQYVGGELNSTVKPWESCDVRWALMYPDAYEVGLPNQGVMILYEVLNEREGVLAERTYSVWPDLEELMREHRVPQFTVDSHRPVGAFDVFGLSFSTELGYTNMLTALDLAGIPLNAADRTVDDPIVLVSGHAAFNPEPIAEFIDCAVVGDGEQAVLEITDIIRAWKAEGRPGGREEVLFRLARTGGVYVPAFYDVEYLPDGRIARVVPNRSGVPWRVSKHTVMDLDEWPYPKQPLVPLAETVHERMSVEIFRGCTCGCRFCQAGDDHPPGPRALHHRHRRDGRQGAQGHRLRGGRPALPLLRRPQRDRRRRQGPRRPVRGGQDRPVPPLDPRRRLQRRPRQRADPQRPPFRPHLRPRGRLRADAEGHQQDGLRGGPDPHRRHRLRQRLAPGEAVLHVRPAHRDRRGRPPDRRHGDQRHRQGPPGLRLPGHPLHRLHRRFRPQAAHPFQWAPQLSAEQTDARLEKLRDKIRGDKKYGRSIGFRYHDGKPGIVEGLLSRGDRRIGSVIRAVYEDGGRFDGWREYFSYDRWMACAEKTLPAQGVDVDWYTTRERTYEEVLPWDHLDSGLDKEWLWEDWQDALDETEVEDCRWTPCFDCGVCPQMDTSIQIGPTGKKLLPLSVVGQGK